MSYQSGQTNALVTVSGGFGFPLPSSSQTLFTIDRVTGSAGSGTLATVTAGKVAYVIGLSVCYTSNAYLKLMDNAGSVCYFMLDCLANTNSAIGGYPIAKYTAGQAIKYECTANALISMVYIEVAA